MNELHFGLFLRVMFKVDILSIAEYDDCYEYVWHKRIAKWSSYGGI